MQACRLKLSLAWRLSTSQPGSGRLFHRPIVAVRHDRRLFCGGFGRFGRSSGAIAGTVPPDLPVTQQEE
jgi:hypothetical protein